MSALEEKWSSQIFVTVCRITKNLVVKVHIDTIGLVFGNSSIVGGSELWNGEHP